MVIDSFILGLVGLEHQFSHLFFDAELDTGYCVPRKDLTTRWGLMGFCLKFASCYLKKTAPATARNVSLRSGSESVGEFARC